MCQTNSPDALLPAGVKVASLPTGRDVRSGVSASIAWPSGSEALTAKWSVPPSSPSIPSGAKTVGARSVCAIAMAVAAEAESALEAVNVTLYAPAWPNVGVHESVPEVLPEPARKEAPAVVAGAGNTSGTLSWTPTFGQAGAYSV